MKVYEELDKRSTTEVEKSIAKRWKKENILEKTIENRSTKEDWVFYDGPIYANAKPGIHHVFAKTIKDTFCKYKTMQGYRVLRKIGLDTHGLPIEVNVEKKLGFTGKADIEAYGVENFCKECNKETKSNIDEVVKITDMMGQFIDCEHPYVTCSNEYIESEWWILKEMEKKGLLYNGSKVLPYCPRCGTELATHEVSQGYQEDTVNTVIVPFKMVEEEVYFLVWTTTPWTLMANVAICVNPDLTYIKAESMGHTFILAENLAESVLGSEYTVLEKYKGSELAGISYEPLMPFVTVEGKSHIVLADSYVTAEDGTGIVHIAPAFGEDDNRVCRLNDIGFVNPVGKDGCYTEGPWKGTLVTSKDLEIEIIKYLKENDKLFKKIKMTHDYPHCWRCKQPLIYYAKPAWYIKTTACKEEIIEANNSIHWYPDYVGSKRFNNWLENMIDWGVSRNRYWGCPMPIWKCSCGHYHVIGSLDELQEMVIEDVDVRKIELHRPYIDALHIKCSACGSVMDRVLDVMDVWFDSGAMPYAQFHYPFENKELFERQFPADFIAEGVDQTRGWFYVLLVISTIISGKSSFKNVVVNDMMLDQYGKKMSKSVGNIIDPASIMTEYGADTIRFYMMYVSPVWTPLKFAESGVKEVYSKFFNPFKNTYSFFQTYANIDKIEIDSCFVPVEEREEIDRWLLSKYNKLVRDVTSYYEAFDLNLVARAITSFVSDDLSNWYIRRNRDRFWTSSLTTSKKSVYRTTYEVLEGLCRLCAPIIPYMTEEIYTKLTGEDSVHLSNFPTYDENLINEEIETKMDLVRTLIRIGRYVREEAKIKVRQPLQKVLLDGKNKEVLQDLVPLIEEELNIKEVSFVEHLTEYMELSVKPNFRVCGKLFGPSIKEFQSKLEELEEEKVISLQEGNSIFLEIANKEMEITPAMVEIRISSKESFNVGMENNQFVILDTTLTEDLLLEGIAREMISKVQQLRKNKDFNVEDRITLYCQGDVMVSKCLHTFEEYIKSETLATSIVEECSIEEYDLNGHECFIDIKR